MANKSRAEYFRDYRATTKPMKEKSGIRKCVEFLREHVGGKALTGHQAAAMIERSILADEPAEATARRQFVDALRTKE